MTVITAVHTHRVSLPLRFPFVTALRHTDHVETLLVCLDDDAGRSGWGEAPQVWQVTGESVIGAQACVEQMLAPVLIGQPLADWPRLADRVTRAVARNGGAKAAVQTALLDLVCRADGMPLVQLLARGGDDGGRSAAHRDRGWGWGSGWDGRSEPEIESAVESAIESATREGSVWSATDVTLSAADLARTVQSAVARVGDGFTTLKLKVGTDASADVARVVAVRREVGDGIGLRLDANQGWSREAAVGALRVLEAAGVGVEFVEQPVTGEDIEGLAWVRSRVDTPVVADEAVFTMTDLERVVRLQAADGVNVKLAKAGGPLPAMEQLRFAQQAGLMTMVGSMMESDLGVAAALHVAVAGQASLVADLDAAWWLRRPVPMTGLHYGGAGIVRLDPGPGVGVVPTLSA